MTETQDVCTTKALANCSSLMLGSSGVALFFMISGFIMVTTTWHDFGQPGAGQRFFLRRIFRIVPLYWAVTTAVICGALIVPSILRDAQLDLAYLAGSYFFWPMERLDGVVKPIVKLGWTLNIEIMFYVLFSLSLFASRRIGIGLVIFILTCLSLAKMSGMFLPSGPFPSVALQFWGDAMILNFVTGILTGVAYMRGLRNHISPVLNVAMLCVFAVFSVILAAQGSGSLQDGSQYGLASTFPLAAFFILAVLGPQVDAGKAMWKPALVLGNISYSLYLIHPFVLRLMTKMWIGFMSEAHIWVFQVASLVAAVIVSLGVYALLEKPLTAMFAHVGRDASAGDSRTRRVALPGRPIKI